MDPEQRSERHPATPIVSQVESTHQRIRRYIEALGQLESFGEIGAVAEELVDLLKQHFHDEEKPGGLFDELGSLRPVIDSQLKFLRGEHREILETLEDLRRQVREAAAVHQQGELEQREDHIRTSALAFVQLIHHHERIESHLVSETYYTEEGGRG